MTVTTLSEQPTLPIVRLIGLLDQLGAQSLLTRLYQAGALNQAPIEHRQQYQQYQQYQALQLTPHYHEHDRSRHWGHG